MDNNSNTTSTLALTAEHRPSNEVKFCWICFTTDSEDVSAEWVHPCKCSGTVRWVHQKCLQRWIDEKQKGNTVRSVKCPHCLTDYIIILPRMGIFILVLHEINELVKTFCPFLVAGIGAVVLYWTSVTYGALTVLQAMGYDDGMKLLDGIQPLALLLGLPSIPVTLIASQFVKWDEILLKCIGKYTNRPRMQDSTEMLHETYTSLPVSGSRILCSALLLPTMSSIVGKAFKNVRSNLLKTILGGLTFVVVKGAIKILLQLNESARKRHKKVLNYTESNLTVYLNTRAATSLSTLDSRSASGSSVLGSSTSMELLVVDNIMRI